MSISTFLSYLRALSPRIPPEHWWVLSSTAIAVSLFLLIRKDASIYGACMCGATILFGLFLLDAMAIKRLLDGVERVAGFDLMAEYQRIVNGSIENRLLLLFNCVVFVPFGALLLETIYELRHDNPIRHLHIVLWVAFGLAFCIEAIQLAFHVGVFEVTDLVLNTLGAGIGAGIVWGLKQAFRKRAT